MHTTRRCFGRRFLVSFSAALTILITGPGLVPAASAAKSKTALTITARGVKENRLLLFIPGTGLTASQSSNFLNTAADAGFDVVGVNYANSKSVASICGKDSACFGAVRREIVFGTDSSPKVDVPPANSIVGRLKAAISANFSGYLVSGEPDWSKIVVSGHSQGAGHAAILGIDRPTVNRVALIAGPNDLAKKKLPSWVVSSSNASSRWFALGHDDDKSLGTQEASWDRFGVPGGSRKIESYSAGDAHLSLVVDSELGPTSTLVPDWKTLIGNTGT